MGSSALPGSHYRGTHASSERESPPSRPNLSSMPGITYCPPTSPLHRGPQRLSSSCRKQRALPCPVNRWGQSPFILAQGVLGVLFFLARQTGMNSHIFPGQTQKRNIYVSSVQGLLPWDLTAHRNWLWFGANINFILYFKTF